MFLIFVCGFLCCSSWCKILMNSNQGRQIHETKSCRVLCFILSTAWDGSMLIKTFYPPRPFSKPCRGPGLSPLPPSHHNHTCLILSNLSFILANQLQRCTLFSTTCFPVIHLYSLLLLPQIPRSYPLLPLFSPSLSRSLSSVSWHQGQSRPVQAPGLKQISLGLYSSTRIKNS